MTINEIKSELGYDTLNLNTAQDTNGNDTEWLRHWDNDGRIAVSIHKETVSAIKDGGVSTLALQSEVREGAQGKYIAKRIVMFTPAEVTL